MTKRICAFYLIGIIFPAFLGAQNSTDLPTKTDSAYIEVAGFGSTSNSHMPFWMHTNQWGVVPKSGNGGSLRVGWAGAFPIARSTNDDLRIIGGIQAVENITNETRFLLPEAYVGLSLGKLEIFAGRKKQLFGLADSTIGSGSYITSGNAMPHFRVQIGFKDYTNIPFTNGWAQLLASYSDGFMDTDRTIVRGLKLHQKQLYVRVGAPNGWIRFYGGANHMVQWGGKSPFFADYENPASRQMPTGFKAYLDMVLGNNPPDTESALPEASSRIGYQLGTMDLGFEFRTYDADFFLYRQNIYETGSMYSFINFADGLQGLRMRRNNLYGAAIEIHEAVVEFLHTTGQGGPGFESHFANSGGRYNFFNHYQVRDGWSYGMRTIGTPFITPGIDTRHLGQRFIYGDSFTNNNRVMAVHLGVKGAIAHKVFWTMKLSYSRNFGVYDLDDIWPAEGLGQFSGFLALQKNINWAGGLTIGLNYAMDYGDLYPVSHGAMLSLKKPLYF